jgi:Flp pilus assembly protein TadB
MFTGILLIIAGVLIAIYPPLLAWVVALFLITLGVLVATTAHYHRKYERRMDNPVIEFIFRY